MKLISQRDVKTRETKSKIYEATKQILQKYGFKYVTVRNVCEEAKVTQGAFYYHFDNKESLLSEYGKETLSALRLSHPLPEKIDACDYIKVINWHLYVYCLYCREMGRSFVGYHLDNCSKDIFYTTCFQDCVISPLKSAISRGYFALSNAASMDYILEDIENIYTGILRCWSKQRPENTEASPPEAIMYRIMMRFLLTFATPEYQSVYTMRNEHSGTGDDDFEKRFESFHKIK